MFVEHLMQKYNTHVLFHKTYRVIIPSMSDIECAVFFLRNTFYFMTHSKHTIAIKYRTNWSGIKSLVQKSKHEMNEQ